MLIFDRTDNKDVKETISFSFLVGDSKGICSRGGLGNVMFFTK